MCLCGNIVSVFRQTQNFVEKAHWERIMSFCLLSVFRFFFFICFFFVLGILDC